MVKEIGGRTDSSNLIGGGCDLLVEESVVRERGKGSKLRMEGEQLMFDVASNGERAKILNLMWRTL